MNDIVTWFVSIGNQLGNWNYLILTVIAFLEALPIAGFFVPGVIALLIGGFLAAQGLLNFSQLLILVSIGSFLGDSVAFAIGRRFGRSFTKEHRILKTVYLESAERFTKRWGKISLIIGRFISSVRSMINVVSGAARMSWATFMYRTAIGSLLFSFIYIGLGYIAGNAWESVSGWSSRAAALIAGLIILLLCLGWFKGFMVRQGKELKKIAASIIKTVYITIADRLTPFLRKRLNPDIFFGLPLVSLILLILLLVAFIFWFGFSATQAGSLWASLDQRVIAFIDLFLNNHIAVTMFIITTLGSFGFIIVAGAVFTFWLLFEHRRSYTIALWLAIVGSLLSSTLVKVILARPRPIPVFYFENSYAFPSSHAALSCIFFLFLAYYAIRAYPRWSRNVSVIFIASFIILLVGFSRLYLGVHYLSDVLGGYALGGSWLLVGIIAQRALQKLDAPRRLPKYQQLVLIISILVLTGGIYITKIFDKNAIQDLYRFEPISRVQSANAKQAIEDKLIPLYTENLRGGRKRPVQIIFKSSEAALRELLSRNGWIERRPPTLGTVLHRGSALLFKVSYPDAPLRPRFWNNEPNNFAFTKPSPEYKGMYTLRLWRSALVENNTDIFMAEIWGTADISLVPNSQSKLIEASGRELLANITASNPSAIEMVQVSESQPPVQIITLH